MAKSIQALLNESNTLLFSCYTLFPFTLFPSKIEISETRVEIIYGIFFFANQSVSILIQDIINVVVSTNIFFGSVHFEIKGFTKNPPAVHRLSKQDAIKIKQIVTGLIEMKQAHVSLEEAAGNKKTLIQEIGTAPTEVPIQ